MLFKKILTGVLTLAMFTGVVSTDLTAVGATDYKAYAAELDELAYDGDDLGATYTKDETTFKVWSPKANAVSQGPTALPPRTKPSTLVA